MKNLDWRRKWRIKDLPIIAMIANWQSLLNRCLPAFKLLAEARWGIPSLAPSIGYLSRFKGWLNRKWGCLKIVWVWRFQMITDGMRKERLVASNLLLTEIRRENRCIIFPCWKLHCLPSWQVLWLTTGLTTKFKGLRNPFRLENDRYAGWKHISIYKSDNYNYPMIIIIRILIYSGVYALNARVYLPNNSLCFPVF